MSSLFDTLAPWRGFYSLIGSASATLVGLLFVAASVGSGVYTRDTHHALRAFLSPTVVHFSAVLAACLIALAPIRSTVVGGGLVAAAGLFGLAYALIVVRSLSRHGLMTKIDQEDRVYYALLPPIGYCILVASGAALAFRPALGCVLLPAALCALLLVGIRNAWDMTLWTVMRHRE